MARKPPRSVEERQARAAKSMIPGTLGGRVASAGPLAVDTTRLDPRLRTNHKPSPGGGFDPTADPIVIGVSATSDAPSDAVSIGSYAYAGQRYDTAVGNNHTIADGGGSTAIGAAANATGDTAIAIGFNAYAQGVGSIAAGLSADAVADNSIAIGSNAITPTNFYSGNADNIAIGRFTQAGGNRNSDAQNTAIGFNANAYDGHGTALGGSAIAEAGYSTALGYSSHAGGAGAVAVGVYSVANQQNAVAIGDGAGATATEAVSIGYQAAAAAADGTAIGPQAFVSPAAPNGTAIGYSSTAQHDHGVAIGWNARTIRDGNVMIGRNAGGGQLHLSMNDDDAIYLYDAVDDVIRNVRISGGALVIT